MDDNRELTHSIWMDSVRGPQQDALPGDLFADVCIVGAGISGLTTAYMLQKSGQSVIVLDSRGIGKGQTQRTTAHLSNAIDARYTEIERLHGEQGATLVAQSHTAAIGLIDAIRTEEAIDCGFEVVDGFLFLGPDHDLELLKRESLACHRAGLMAVELLKQTPLAAFSSRPCLRFPRQAQIAPLRYLYGLAQAVIRRGGQIFANTHVQEIEGGERARIVTVAGPVVTARAVVVATNSPINDVVTMHTKQAAYRSYALAAEMPTPCAPNAIFWDTVDPYHYIRTHRERDPGAATDKHFLIVGGEDHKTGQSDPEQCQRRLEAWTRGHFPQLGPTRYSWSGQVLETIDGLAFIGRNPGDEPNVFIATGDCGMGMTHGTIAGHLLCDLILGRENRWAQLYDPARKTLRAAGEFARENLNTAWQYTDWLTTGEVSSADDIAPGEGATIRSGLTKLAVYRDPHGQLHERSAVCPHLGGIVHWNSGEKTWDCPCHGSRFDRFGCVLDGPAAADLRPAGKGAAVEVGN